MVFVEIFPLRLVSGRLLITRHGGRALKTVAGQCGRPWRDSL